MTEAPIIVLPRCLAARAPGPHRDIGIAGGIDDPPGEDGFAAGLALRDDTLDGTILHDRCHTQPVQQRLHTRFLHQHIGNVFEHLGIERVTERLRLRHCRAHRLARVPQTRCRCPSQSTVFSCRYQAKPSTPTCVILPPKQPLRSMSAVRAPARAKRALRPGRRARCRPPAHPSRAQHRPPALRPRLRVFIYV